MVNIKISDSKIIFDGHADTRAECDTISLMCEELAKSDKFRTIKHENGYAEFEKVRTAGDLKFWWTDTEFFTVNSNSPMRVDIVGTTYAEIGFSDAGMKVFKTDGTTGGISRVHIVTASNNAEYAPEDIFERTTFSENNAADEAIFPWKSNVKFVSVGSNEGENGIPVTLIIGDVFIKYNGVYVSSTDTSGSAPIKTEGKYCEGDITIEYIDPEKPTQEKTITVTENSTTEVTPDSGKVLSKVTIITNIQTAVPEEVSTTEAMNALCITPNVGKAYKFTGTTDDTYTNGDIYVVKLEG